MREASSQHGPVVAIDGPAGAGKSTVAAHLAQRFGLMNLETGAMYRALAWKALAEGVPVDDADAVYNLTQSTDLQLDPEQGGNRVMVDGVDVTADLRRPDVTAAASQVSVHGPVRAWMVDLQRRMGRAARSGVVMEGRDIGTVVFPDADVKLFLDASPEARGDRRFAQTAGDGSRDALLAEMRARDIRDRTRAESPLRPAEDAITLNTTGMPLAEVLSRAEALVLPFVSKTCPSGGSSD